MALFLSNSDQLNLIEGSVKTPKPLLSKSKEKLLSIRQKKALEDLEELIKGGYPQLTMSEIAANLKVSLRTLYEIAPKKEELILIAVDRLLFKIGAAAQKAINLSDSPMAKLNAFLNETNKATERNTLAFTEDFGRIQGAKDLVDSHENYVMNVTEQLLEEAIIANEIISIDTSAMALILSGLSRELDKKYLKKELKITPSDALKEIIEVIFKGLKRTE